MDDHIKRWMTHEGTFRILTALSTSTVQDAVTAAETNPEVSSLYGRLLTGSALLQLAQSPIDRVQCSLEHAGTAGALLADVWPGPCVRGRVENPNPSGPPYFGGDGVVHVSRQPARGGPLYQSASPMSGDCVAHAIEHFTMDSEQVLTYVSLVTKVAADGEIEVAGGMFVQALPGWTELEREQIESCLARTQFAHLVSAGDTPFDAASSIFQGMSLVETGADPLIYRCRCSKQAAVNAVKMLSATELQEVRAGGEENVTCDYCRTTYTVVAADLTSP